MLKAHKELLEQIQQAEAAARKLYALGCQVDDVVAGLRDTAEKVKLRIRAYQKEAPAAQPERKAKALAPVD